MKILKVFKALELDKGLAAAAMGIGTVLSFGFGLLAAKKTVDAEFEEVNDEPDALPNNDSDVTNEDVTVEPDEA